MVAWSSMGFKNFSRVTLSRSLFILSKGKVKNKGTNYVPARHSGHERTFQLEPSEYNFKKFKDMTNFYLLLGIIPLGLLIAYTYIFIGPAELVEIPEGYEPKHWEYYPNPITRFIAKNLLRSRQEVYERNLHNLYIMNEYRQLRILGKRIEELMADRLDYQSWYFDKPMVKYDRATEEILREGNEKAANQTRGFVF